MTFLVQRIFGRFQRRPLRAAAIVSRELWPAEETIGKPALVAVGNLDAIIESIPGSNMVLEMNRVLGRPCKHLPTISYELSNARIKGEYVASGMAYGKYETNRPSADRHDHGFIKEAFLSTNILSGKEFGHWLRDALVSEIHGKESNLPRLGLAREPWQHEPTYRAVAQMPCAYPYKAKVGRLMILDDRGLNTHWAARFSTLRRQMRSGVAQHMTSSAGPLLFVDRGSGARMRDPINLAQIKAVLERRGFHIVTPTDLNAAEIGLALRDARIAVSVEGSHLNHLHCFAPDGLTLITLQDPRRFSAHHKRIIDLYGDRFGLVIGKPDPKAEDRYQIDIDQLQSVIDMALASARN